MREFERTELDWLPRNAVPLTEEKTRMGYYYQATCANCRMSFDASLSGDFCPECRKAWTKADGSFECRNVGSLPQKNVDPLREALSALLVQALQSELNNPSHEWGWEAIGKARAALGGKWAQYANKKGQENV